MADLARELYEEHTPNHPHCSPEECVIGSILKDAEKALTKSNFERVPKPCQNPRCKSAGFIEGKNRQARYCSRDCQLMAWNDARPRRSTTLRERE